MARDDKQRWNGKYEQDGNGLREGTEYALYSMAMCWAGGTRKSIKRKDGLWPLDGSDPRGKRHSLQSNDQQGNYSYCKVVRRWYDANEERRA